MVEIVQQMEKLREDSFWYRGLVAKIGNYHLIATGDIRICFPGEDIWYKDAQAVDEARYRNYIDNNLQDVEWGNNNWFEVIKVDDEGNMIDCEIGDVTYDYNEGIELLKHYWNTKQYEGENLKEE